MLCFQTQTSKMLSHSLTAFLTYLRYYLLLHLVQKAKFLSSSNVKATLRWLSFWGGGGGDAQKPKFVVFSVKKEFIRHFARFNFSRLSSAFILKYYPILHVVKS